MLMSTVMGGVVVERTRIPLAEKLCSFRWMDVYKRFNVGICVGKICLEWFVVQYVRLYVSNLFLL